MLNKKGVSEVVANVLIVLLVIVGIAVIWSVVKPTIDKGAKGIQADCFTVSIEPVSCVITNATTGASNVVIKRNPGAGSFDAVDLIFENAAGGTTRFTPTTAITSTGASSFDELETLTVAGVGGSNVKKVNVVFSSAGNLCQPVTQPIDCV